MIAITDTTIAKDISARVSAAHFVSKNDALAIDPAAYRIVHADRISRSTMIIFLYITRV